MSWGLPTGLLQRWIHCSVQKNVNENLKQYTSKDIVQIENVHTRVWCWGFVVDPLDDFEAILSRDYCDTGDTGNEMLQGYTTLQGLTAQLQWAKFFCIAVWKTKGKTHYINDFIHNVWKHAPFVYKKLVRGLQSWLSPEQWKGSLVWLQQTVDLRG